MPSTSFGSGKPIPKSLNKMHIGKKRLEFIIFAAVILIAIFFRFWQIRNYVVFLGDEGRDMLVMRNMILEKRPVFLGPTASVGGFYLGPIYYWMAAPFLALSMFDPIGPSIMVAAFGVATVILLYKFLKEVAGFWPATLASLLYATAPLIVRYSRSSWNPNPLPFFALLQIYSVYSGVTRKKPLFFLVAGLSFGVAIQLHYLAISLVPITIVIIALNSNIKNWSKAFILTLVGALITFSPFLIFELRHHFPNFITIYEFVTRKTTHGYQSPNTIWIISNFGNILLEDIAKFTGTVFTKIVFWLLAVGSIFTLAKNWQNDKKRLVSSICVVWFLGGLATLRFYSGQIFDYYFGFMFPAPFFAYGVLAGETWRKNIFKLIFISFTIFASTLFLTRGFWQKPPNRLINQTQRVADFVIQKAQGKPYNFALISEHNSDHAYRYFLEIKGAKPVELETIITDQLLIICESKKCAPLGYPSWEIAGFGRGELNGQWELPDIGIRVMLLTHWPGAPNPAGKPAVKGQ